MALDLYGGLPTSLQHHKQSSKPQKSSTPKQPFRYLVVLDFEATCDQNRKVSPQEIIEWPAMIIDTESNTILPDKFHFYIKPQYHPNLTPFCTKLTGITQAMIDINGQDILSVINWWNKWCFDHKLLPIVKSNGDSDDNGYFQHNEYTANSNYKAMSCIVTCGDWDLKTMWTEQHSLCQTNASLFHCWINLKVLFQQKVSKSGGNGMMSMLKTLNIPHVGRHHSGIDDVRNLCQIVLKMLKRGIVFDCTTKKFGKRSMWTDIQIKQDLETRHRLKKRKIHSLQSGSYDKPIIPIKSKKQKISNNVIDLTSDDDVDEQDQKSSKE